MCHTNRMRSLGVSVVPTTKIGRHVGTTALFALLVNPCSVIFRRSRVQFPTMEVPLFDLLRRMKRFIVLVLHSEGASDVIYERLIRDRMSSPRCLLAHE